MVQASLGGTQGTRRGKVYLVGAGPGDPDLLTLKAARAIACADTILIDNLANRAVLSHARADAHVIEVGKRGGCKSTSQAFIERLMLRFARGGRVVVRIKGGDPFVFGRGGEEMLFLRAAGVDVEVVSGITAGIGVPASLGIPVTHRGLSQGVTLVTGHAHAGAAGPNWAALAASGTTLVIYMGVANLDSICAALLAAGMQAATPAAAIQSGTTRDQRAVVATLASLGSAVATAALASPAIVVIGAVAALADGATAMAYQPGVLARAA